MIKWESRPSAYLYSDDWTCNTQLGRIEVTRVSHRILGTPWRVTFPNGNTLRVANADEGKRQAEQWLAKHGGNKEGLDDA